MTQHDSDQPHPSIEAREVLDITDANSHQGFAIEYHNEGAELRTRNKALLDSMTIDVPDRPGAVEMDLGYDRKLAQEIIIDIPNSVGSVYTSFNRDQYAEEIRKLHLSAFYNPKDERGGIFFATFNNDERDEELPELVAFASEKDRTDYIHEQLRYYNSFRGLMGRLLIRGIDVLSASAKAGGGYRNGPGLH